MSRRRWYSPLPMLAALLWGCSGERVTAPAASGPASDARLQVVYDRAAAEVGDTVRVQVHIRHARGWRVGGIALELASPIDTWRYVGQLPTRHLALIRPGSRSEPMLRLSASDPSGLPDMLIELRFVAERAGSVGFAVTPLELAGLDGRIVPGSAVPVASGPAAFRPQPGTPAQLTAADWLARLDPGYPRDVLRRPGDGTIFGDANLSGTVTSGDAVVLANVVVGNLELLVDLNRDLPIAGNVAPANLPGLGEADDPLPPGEAADGSRAITVADQLVVQQFIVGNPVPVVGQPIPGRTGGGGRPRVILSDDTLRTDRTFTRDTVYEIRGTLLVGDRPDGTGTAPRVTLAVQPGTVLEFDPATNGRLVVATGSRLVALGTRLEPVVFTCASVARFPGCWGGVHLNGFALLNNSEQIGSPLKTGRGGTGTYGGILNADSSGVLRYVRIEYAGRPVVAGDTLAALQLLGTGSGTLLDFVQVYRPLGDALFVSGGRPRLRHVMLTDHGGVGLRWNDGFVGRAQFMIVQQGRRSHDAFRGRNADLDARTGPRSAPLLSHVTVVGPSPLVPGSRVLRLEQGSGGRLLNLVALRAAEIGFDVDGVAACDFLAAHPDSTGLAAALFFANVRAYAADEDCVDESAYATAAVRRNREADPMLVGPFVTGSADLRPSFGSPAAAGDSLTPDDGFFDRGARYVGAVPPAPITRNAIPWYAGWSLGY